MPNEVPVKRMMREEYRAAGAHGRGGWYVLCYHRAPDAAASVLRRGTIVRSPIFADGITCEGVAKRRRKRMDEEKLESARRALTTRRDEVLAELDRLGQEMQWLGTDQADERGSLGNHLADDGSDLTEQERIGTVAEDFRDLLRQIDGALARIENGTYGICQRCGRPINEERLEAFPYVEYCIEDQTFLERQRALYGSTRQRVG
jgi:RNA polymerase-binding transcription factor DksA